MPGLTFPELIIISYETRDYEYDMQISPQGFCRDFWIGIPWGSVSKRQTVNKAVLNRLRK